jgi:hypothetical protein
MRPACNHLLILLFIFTFITITKGKSQVVTDSTLMYQIETIDGNLYAGKVLKSDDSKIMRLHTENLGDISIPVKTIKQIQALKPEQIKNGELWPESPHSTRYFYLPNGYGLKQGEGYYQNTWVLFNQVSYGFTDNFSVGVGLIPTFLFGVNGAPVWITPKFSFPVVKDHWNLGVGAIVGTYIGEGSSSNFGGLTYGVSTFGPRDKNITIGLGYAFFNSEWSSTPLFSLGGTIRTGKRHYLVTENYMVFSNNEMVAMLWGGGRFVSKHLAVDYGFIVPAGPGVDRIIAFPWLGITVPFGHSD